MQFGRYELLTELARGGMATLHLARRVGPDKFQRLVAIKLVNDQLSDDPEIAGRFLDEARLAARIVHPNVVQIFDFNRHEGSQYIAMEYVHGVDLMAVFNRAAELGRVGFHWSHAARVVADAAAGLHAAHELVGDDGRPLGLVHRDVSPQNILLSFDGHVKVTDFGIAHAVGKAHKTLLGVVIGKVAYMSPEQCRGLPLDRRCDVFALGVVLHEMVTLRRLFRADTDQETMQRVVKGEVPPLRSVAADVPDALQALVDRALAREPVERFQTAAEMQNALDELLVKEGLLINAGSVQTLLGALFPEERIARDAYLAQIYRKTILPGAGETRQPAPTRPLRKVGQGEAAHTYEKDMAEDGSAPGDEADPWGEAAAPTIQDTAPPAVLRASGAFRTRLGFDGPGQETSRDPPTPDAPDVSSSPNQGLDMEFLRHDTAMGRPAMPDPWREAPTLAPESAAGLAPTLAPSRPHGTAGTPAPAMAQTSEALPEDESAPLSPMPVAGARPARPSESMGHVTASLVASFQRRRWAWLVALVGATLLVALLVAFALGRGTKKETAPSTSATRRAPESGEAQLPPPPVRSGKHVTVRVRTTPAEARLWVGEEEWARHGDASAVRTIRLAKQSAPVVLRVEASGYKPEERLIVPTEVVPGKGDEIDIALEPLVAAPSGQRTGARTGRTPTLRSPRVGVRRTGGMHRPSTPSFGMRSGAEAVDF